MKWFLAGAPGKRPGQETACFSRWRNPFQQSRTKSKRLSWFILPIYLYLLVWKLVPKWNEIMCRHKMCLTGFWTRKTRAVRCATVSVQKSSNPFSLPQISDRRAHKRANSNQRDLREFRQKDAPLVSASLQVAVLFTMGIVRSSGNTSPNKYSRGLESLTARGGSGGDDPEYLEFSKLVLVGLDRQAESGGGRKRPWRNGTL